jgi:hypothetical protein
VPLPVSALSLHQGGFEERLLIFPPEMERPIRACHGRQRCTLDRGIWQRWGVRADSKRELHEVDAKISHQFPIPIQIPSACLARLTLQIFGRSS